MSIQELNIINTILKVSKNTFVRNYDFIQNEKDRDLVIVALSVFMLFKVLKIDTSKINLHNKTLKSNLDEILIGFLSSDILDNNIDEKDKLHDFIHDKDDVGFREYVPSGEGDSIRD